MRKAGVRSFPDEGQGPLSVQSWEATGQRVIKDLPSGGHVPCRCTEASQGQQDIPAGVDTALRGSAPESQLQYSR